MVNVTLLGTAALFPLPDRALTAAALTCGGHTILFDCGEGTQTAARRTHVSLMKIGLIALTHYHGDHIFGLPGLLQTMYSMGRTETLYITGPEGLREAMEPILKLTGWTSYEIVLMDSDRAGIRLASLVSGWPEEAYLTPFPTEHRVPSQGYCFTLGRCGKFQPARAKALGVPVKLWGRLQKGQEVQVGAVTVRPEQIMGAPRKGLKFVFSGDTLACDSLRDAAQDADLAVFEATYGEIEQGELAIERGHMNFVQAARVAADANVRELWLTHFSQMMETPEAYLPDAKAIFEHTVCGTDGMAVTLNFPKE